MDNNNLIRNKFKTIIKRKTSVTALKDIDGIDVHEDFPLRCNKCGTEFSINPADTVSHGKITCLTCHPKTKIDFADFPAILKKEYGDEYTILSGPNTKKSQRILLKHNECGFNFTANMWNFLHRRQCPKCTPTFNGSTTK